MEVSHAYNRLVERVRTRSFADDSPTASPLIQRFREKRPAKQAFSNLDVLFIQHHLGPLVPRIKAMVEDGLVPERCWFVDIPYSTNNQVIEELERLGCPRSQRPPPFNDPLEPYDAAQMSRVEQMVRQLASRRKGRFLVIDDGAYFCRILGRSRIAGDDLGQAFIGRTHLVEQTTRGHRYLTGELSTLVRDLNISVVTIARSQTKQVFEGPFIGASVAKAIVERTVKLLGERQSPDVARVLIIGFGVVGEATTRALRRDNSSCPIDVLEVDAQKASAIRALRCRPVFGFPSLMRRSAIPYDLVIGCTGYASFPLHARSLLGDGALLASGSSAAVELNREGFIELAQADPTDDLEVLDPAGTRRAGIRATISISGTVRGEGRVFSFLHAGFPVNFDGRIEHLPFQAIEPTHALLFAACRQVLLDGPGLRELNVEDDSWIADQALEQLR